MGNQTRSVHEFAIDLRGIIKLLARNLYPEKDVFVREMLQNAHDSIARRRVEAGNDAPAGVIRIRIDPVQRRISFIDNGRGLTEGEIHDYLSTIGRSGTEEFRQQLIQMGRQAEVSLIGQFGIGLLSAFVVADQVEVVTRSSLPNQPAWRWTSYGEKEYVLERLDESHTIGVGTTVTLTIAPGENDDLLQAETIRKAIRKYADFLAFPIYLNEETTPSNAIVPPWHRLYTNDEERLKEYHAFLDRRFPDYILHVIPVNISSPLRVYGALYISDRIVLDLHASGTVDIYQSGMFVQTGNRDLLPPWAKFVRGILDSPDLTLTLARDGLQKDAAFSAAQEVLGRVIVENIKQLAQQNPDKLQRLLNWHATGIKMMALAEEDFYDEIANLVPFETNRGMMDLQTYFQYSQVVDESGKRYLFYFTEGGSATLYYLLADERGLVVINASHAFDEEFLERYAQKQPVKLQLINVPESTSIFTPLPTDERQRFRKLEVEVKRILPDPRSTAQVVRFRPIDMPAVMMHSTEAKLYRDLESAKENVRLPDSIRKLVERVLDDRPSIPVILYLNADNPIIQRLNSLDLRSEVAQSAIAAIYNNSFLLATPVFTRRDVEIIARQFNQVVDLLLSSTANLEQLRTRLSMAELSIQELRQVSSPAIEKTKHVTCFIAVPFNGYNVILEALREVLEDKPYFWQVVRADEEHLDPTVYGSVYKHIARAHCYIAEVSEHNFNVGLELGLMQQFHDRPKVLLRHSNAKPLPADIKGAIYISYPALKDVRKSDLVDLLRDQLPRINELKAVQGEMHYLSPIVLHRFGLDMRLAEALARQFVTAEEFIRADAKHIARSIEKAPGLVEEVQDYIRTVYDLSIEMK